jgi:metal-responsive CopG/Arc/MetJ family transcriptional regulator
MANNKQKTHISITITLPEELVQATKDYCKREERLLSPVIAKAIKLYLENVNNKDKQ